MESLSNRSFNRQLGTPTKGKLDFSQFSTSQKNKYEKESRGVDNRFPYFSFQFSIKKFTRIRFQSKSKATIEKIGMRF